MQITGNVMLLAGNESLVEALLAELEKTSITNRTSSDLHVRTYQLFGVEEARDLRDRAGVKAVEGDRRIFIITAASITNEAQNALLKTLEEPPADALFFFIIPSPELLLPTVRSRAQIVHFSSPPVEGWPKAGVVPRAVDVQKFLAASPAERIDMLKPLLEKGDDDKRDTSEILSFLAELERLCGAGTLDAKTGENLRTIYRAREYMGDKGALVKPLLEQLALLVF